MFESNGTATIKIEYYEKLLETQYIVGDLNKRVSELENQQNNLKQYLLETRFKYHRMGTDTREEQIDIGGGYSGFSDEDIELMQYANIGEEEMIDFINQKWDEREKEENNE